MKEATGLIVILELPDNKFVRQDTNDEISPKDFIEIVKYSGKISQKQFGTWIHDKEGNRIPNPHRYLNLPVPEEYFPIINSVFLTPTPNSLRYNATLCELTESN